MIADMKPLIEYPYKGSFYHITVDKTKPPSQQEAKETLILSTMCDIQESQKGDSGGNITASYNIYFPFNAAKTELFRGCLFRGDKYGIKIEGEVVGLEPTQMGCVVYIKDRRS